jgi:hypothetical protein
MTDIIIYGYDVFKDTTRYNRAAAGAFLHHLVEPRQLHLLMVYIITLLSYLFLKVKKIKG